MATRSVESGIPRTYVGSFRLAGQGVDAIVRAKIGLVYSVGHSVATGAGKGLKAARTGVQAARARKSETASAREKVVSTVKNNNKPIIIGAAAGLAMVGAGLAMLKFRHGQPPEIVELDVEFDDDAQLDEATV